MLKCIILIWSNHKSYYINIYEKLFQDIINQYILIYISIPSKIKLNCALTIKKILETCKVIYKCVFDLDFIDIINLSETPMQSLQSIIKFY